MTLRLSSVRQHAGALEEHLCAFRYVYATCSDSAPLWVEEDRVSTFCERRSSGGLFNFLVGAAFHSRARVGPLFSKARRNSSPPEILQTRPTATPWETRSRFRASSSFFPILPTSFYFLSPSLFFPCFLYEATYEAWPVSHTDGRSFPRRNLN